jgi:hypothetical protein
LYGSETWSLKEEQKMRGFENQVLRRMFGLQREEEAGSYRKLLVEVIISCFYYDINI